MAERLTENKIILVKRKTRLEELIVRYNTLTQAKFYIEHMGGDFSDYLEEDERYKQALSEAYRQVEGLGRVQMVDREYVPNFIFGDEDLVIAVGQDGLVANTLKYLTSQLLIGVNPDPRRWDGVLLPFKPAELDKVVRDVFRKRRPVKEVSMAKAVLNDGQYLYGVNDLFIGQKTHVSARYRLELGGKSEQHSSSGIIVSTGLGSTGWLKSILAGTAGILESISGNKAEFGFKAMDWNSNSLVFSVREPFPTKTTQAQLVFGEISSNSPLRITSYMPENGVIFSDGMESDFLQFNSGMVATISLAEKKGQLVV